MIIKNRITCDKCGERLPNMKEFKDHVYLRHSY